jgi:hypothetical protein
MRSLGISWVFYGVWRLLLGAALLLWSETATMMFGALLTRVADPYSLMALFHVFYGVVILLSAFCGLLGVLAGVILMRHGRNARGTAVLASLFSLPELPLGLILGSYTLYLLARVPGDAR